MTERHPGEASVEDDVHDFLEQMSRLGVVKLTPPRGDA